VDCFVGVRPRELPTSLSRILDGVLVSRNVELSIVNV
jgi:hypothetical protein